MLFIVLMCTKILYDVGSRREISDEREPSSSRKTSSWRSEKTIAERFFVRDARAAGVYDGSMSHETGREACQCCVRRKCAQTS